jgi:hypothetical protein
MVWAMSQFASIRHLGIPFNAVLQLVQQIQSNPRWEVFDTGPGETSVA